MPWLKDKGEHKVLDLPNLDQLRTEIDSRRGYINELEAEVNHLKEVKESLIKETHELFTTAETKVVQATTEAKELKEKAEANFSTSVEKLRQLDEDRVKFENEKRSFFIDKIKSEEFLRKHQEELEDHGRKLNQFKLDLDKQKLETLKYHEELKNGVNEVIENKKKLALELEKVEQAKQYIENEYSELELKKKEVLSFEKSLMLKDTDISKKLEEAQNKHKEAAEYLHEAQVIRGQFSDKEKALREKNHDILKAKLMLEERAQQLKNEEIRINKKQAKLEDLQVKIDKHIEKGEK